MRVSHDESNAAVRSDADDTILELRPKLNAIRQLTVRPFGEPEPAWQFVCPCCHKPTLLAVLNPNARESKYRLRCLNKCSPGDLNAALGKEYLPWNL